jgi:hypothetical protein
LPADLDTRPGGGGLEAGLDAALREALSEAGEAQGDRGEQQHPFDRLQAALDAAHPQGCRRAKLGRWELPSGTFRRMRHSTGAPPRRAGGAPLHPSCSRAATRTAGWRRR